MKVILRIFLIIILFFSLGYLVLTIYFSVGYIDFKGTVNFYITDDIYLSQTSRYMVSLGGKYGIPAYVYKIGWNDKYIVALQYDMIIKDEHSKYKIPDKSVENYYIINLEDDTKIGPITKEEFNKYDCSSIKMKRTST